MKLLKILLKMLAVVVGVSTIALAAGYLLTAGDRQVAKTVAEDPSIPHVELDGIVFHAESFGPDTEATVIVVHGGPGNDYRYLLPLQQLSDAYHVVFYDQRGTGLSPRVPANELNLESSILDLKRIVDYYSRDTPVYMIGHSWGAMLASAFLGRYPDRVRRIVLAEPGFLTTDMAKEFTERTDNFAIALNFENIKALFRLFFEALHVHGQGTDAVKDYIFTGLIALDVPDHPMAGYYCNGRIEPGSLPSWRYGMTASIAIQQSGKDQDGNMHIDLVDGVEAFPDTVLFLSGACNTLIGPDYQQRHVEYFPRSRLEVIEGTGHMMFSEKPELCIRVIKSYFGH